MIGLNGEVFIERGDRVKMGCQYSKRKVRCEICGDMGTIEVGEFDNLQIKKCVCQKHTEHDE